MRRIWFKAKCLSDGSWVAGNFCHRATGDYIIVGECRFAIDPDTVCQLTGMEDVGGDEVWEKDIVVGCFEDYGIEKEYEVVYVVKNGAFAFKSLDDGEIYYGVDSFAIIGNKFDRKEGEG